MSDQLVNKLATIFEPDDYIRDPRFLFGRQDELAQLVTRYGSSRASLPVLTGPPGIGKSSLLFMFKQILVGDPAPLERFDLTPLAPDPRNRLVMWQPCSRRLDSPEALVRLLASNVESVLGSPYSSFGSFHLQGFELEASVAFAKVKGAWARRESGSQDPFASFARAVNALVEAGVIDEAVILLDECEQLPWIEELVDFTRHFAPPTLRFCLALRDSHGDRLVDSRHGDYRFVSRVAVAPLTLTDMRALFETASTRLRRQDIFWTVGDDALAYIAHHSGGEPWYLQMIGHELLFRTVARTGGMIPVGERGRFFVQREYVKDAEKRMLDAKLSGLHAARYELMVRRAPKREEALRTLAQFPATYIPSSFISRFDARRGGVRKTMRYLTAGDDPVLMLRRDGSFEFVEHQFRVYCRLSSPLFPGSDELARASIDAWESFGSN